jgi:glycosyltransferase involved in cell wall biosynthesis
VKIVHLVIGGDPSGGQTVAHRLALAARAHGDTAAFVADRPGPFLDALRAEGFEARVIDVSRTGHVGGLVRLARHLRATRADLLHVHTQIAGNVLGRLAARAARIPVIAHVHIESHLPPGRLRRGALRLLDNATARLCVRILVVSEETRRTLERQGYPRDRLVVVYNGVELPATSGGDRLRRELGVGPDAPVVGEVGRLAEVKGQRELIQAVARLDGDVRLVLVGADVEAGGAYRRELEAEAERLGVRERVLFAGYRADAESLVGELDVVALPSRAEGLPMVLLEAMARGRAVVATPVGGTPELVSDGETGLLVPPCDVDALAAAIGGLLADPERRSRLGEAARRRVAAEFTADRMAERVLAVYDEVVR